MIKPSELRIGSTYHSRRFNMPVTLTAEDIYDLVAKAEGADISHYIDEMFESIELTEEELIKLGFTSVSSNIREVFEIDILNKEQTSVELVMTIRRNGGNVQLLKEKNWITLPSECKYVHQLQILYSSLKDEELTFKTKQP